MKVVIGCIVIVEASMERYDELATLGAEKVRSFEQVGGEVHTFCNRLLVGLRSYMGGPQNAILAQEVDRDHKTQGKPIPIALPCFCFDTYWYFYLWVIFPTQYIGVLVGVHKTGKEYIVRLPETEFRIPDEVAQQAFYEYLFDSIKQTLNSRFTRTEKNFGFRQCEPEKT